MDDQEFLDLAARLREKWAGTLELLAAQEAEEQAEATEFAERYMLGPGRGMTDANRATIARLREERS